MITHNEKAKGRLCFVFSVVQHFTERFKQKDSVIKTCTITAVTKSSLKPRSSAIASSHLCSSRERNGEQRKALVEP